MSIDTPPYSAEALIAAAKGLEENEIQALVARMVIDSLGRPWDPLKHPRDAHGRFIETFAEIRGLFRTSGGAWGQPRISGRVVAFDHNGDVWVRVDHTAPGYTEHRVGDIVPIKPHDMEALDKLATIPKSLDGGQRSQLEALAARMEGRNPGAATALRRAADPANTEPMAQLADMHEARDLLDQDGSPEAIAVRDMVWDLSDQLGDHPSNEENLHAAQAMIRDHLAKNPTQNAEAIARLDQLRAPAPAAPGQPDDAQRLAASLHRVADRLQDQNPADAVHVRNVAAALGNAGLSGQDPEARDHALESAAVAAANIKTPQLRKKILADIKHMRENPPETNAPAPAPERKATLPPPPPAASLPPVPTDAGALVEWARANAKQGGGIKPHENPDDATPEKLLARQAQVEAEIEAIQKKAQAHENGLPIPAQANRLDALVKEHDAILARIPDLNAPPPAAPEAPSAVDSKPEAPNVPEQPVTGPTAVARDARRVDLRRLREDNGGALWRREPYAAGGGADEGQRPDLAAHAVAQLVPDAAVEPYYAAIDATPLTFLELDHSPEAAALYHDAVAAGKAAGPKFGPLVHLYDAPEYEGMTLYLTSDGGAGFGITPDGDIVSVFSNKHAPDKKHDATASLVQAALDAGGTHLDAFDLGLAKFYAAHGFVVTGRVPFDPAQAPDDWRPDLDSPDVVFMGYDPAHAKAYREGDGSYDAEGYGHAQEAAKALGDANAPKQPEAVIPSAAPETPPAPEVPTSSAPDEEDSVDLAVPETAEAIIPAVPEFPQLGELGLGIQWEDMPHGLVLRGNVFPHKDDAKAIGFRFLEVPGEVKRDGAPFKAWTATGAPEKRHAMLGRLAERLGLPDPAAAGGGGDEYPPTEQQQAVIDAVLTGKDTVVRALAGTGKTSTLKMIARRLMTADPAKRIVYVAFNKSIQEEAQRTMPPNVEARTGDSIAFATMSPAIRDKYSDRTTLRRNADIAAFLGITNPIDTGVIGEKPMQPDEQAMRIMRAIEQYSISADDKLGVQHFKNLDPKVAKELLPFAEKAWADINSDGGRIRTTNSHITKMWALSKPDLSKTTSGLKRGANVIFFDEAQDINPVMAKVIADQKIQKVYVGDSNQAIYGFRGAVDELDHIKAPHDLPLTKSWRFGPQIASMGNRFLALIGSKHRIEGAGPAGKVDEPFTMTDPDAILVRSNAGAIGEILQAQTDGKIVGVPKGTKSDLRKLVDTARWLQSGGPAPSQLHDDLAAFRNWDEVAKAADVGDDPKVKMLYKIIEDTGVDKLNDLVNRLVESGDARDNRIPDMYVTTAHKAKGLEWDKVRIGGDFWGPRIDKNTGKIVMPSPEEMKLAYVAVTRAMKELDPGSLAWVYDYTDSNGGTVPSTTPSTPAPPDVPSSPARWSGDVTAPGEASRPLGPSAPMPDEIATKAADLGLGQDVIDAITNGTPEEIAAALHADDRFAEIQHTYAHAVGTTIRTPDGIKARDEWIQLQRDVLIPLKKRGVRTDLVLPKTEVVPPAPGLPTFVSREKPPSGWSKVKPEPGVLIGDQWTKGDYAVFPNDDGTLRVAEFDKNMGPVWRADGANWAEIEAKIAEHENFKKNGGLPADARANIAQRAANYGFGDALVQAIQTGDAKQIADALGADPRYDEMAAAYTDALNADLPQGNDRVAIENWVALQANVVAPLKNAKLLKKEPKPKTDTGPPPARPMTSPDEPFIPQASPMGPGAVQYAPNPEPSPQAEAIPAPPPPPPPPGGPAAPAGARMDIHGNLVPMHWRTTPPDDQDRVWLVNDEGWRVYPNKDTNGYDIVPPDGRIGPWSAASDGWGGVQRLIDMNGGQAAPNPAGPSGELRQIQPRDLGEILGIPHNVAQWLDYTTERALIQDPFGAQEPGFLDDLKRDWQGVADAVRKNDFVAAQHSIDAVKDAIADPNVSPAFREDMQAYVDQAQGILDKVGQRAEGQFEIPGVAQPSAPPRAEQAAPELNAAFADVLQHDPNASSRVKRLAAELEGFRQTLETYGQGDQLAEQVTAAIDALNNQDYQRAFDLLDGVFNQPHGDTPTNDYETGPDRYSNYADFGIVNDVFSLVWDDWTAMLDANPDLAKYNPENPAPEVPDNADQALKELKKRWADIVAGVDAQFPDNTDIGALYNAVIQDQNMTDPIDIQQALGVIYDAMKKRGDTEGVRKIDEVLAAHGFGPESDVPGPYEPLADPEGIIPDPPKGGAEIKDEHRVIDPRIRGEIEDVKRGIGLPELPDRLDIDRNGVAVFALDLVDVPAAGNQGPQGGMRRPAGIGQVRRIYTKNGVRYAEVAFYDPAFVDAPNRNKAKRDQGIKNGDPFYIWEGVRIDKIQKVDGSNPDAVEYLGHLGPEEARQYAGRNAGRLAQNRGRVRPELERMANLQYIGDRYAPDADGLPVGKGDVVVWEGKKYEVVRVNVAAGDDTRLEIAPVGANGEPEIQAGGKHAEPYARLVQFYDKPLTGNDRPAVTVDELKDLVRRLDGNKKYVVGDALRSALEGGDLKEITRAINEDPVILTYMADARAYINDYIGRLLQANLIGNFDAIKPNEQEMIRKDKNDLLNAMAALDGRFLEGTGAERHIRREIPPPGPDREYAGNRPEVLMPLRYVQMKEELAKARAEHPENDGLYNSMQMAVANAGAINLDEPFDFFRARREFVSLRSVADGNGDKALSDALYQLITEMNRWRDEQDKRRAMVQGGPGAEAQLPRGRTVAPGLVRPPGVPSARPVPAASAGPTQDDKAYADLLGSNGAARMRYFDIRNILVDAAIAVRGENPDLAEYLDTANRALIQGRYGEGYHAIEILTAVPEDHPNAAQLKAWQDALGNVGHYFEMRKALNRVLTDWPGTFFPDTPVRPLARPDVPAPAVPNTPEGRWDEPNVRQAFFDFAERQLDSGQVPESHIFNGDEGVLRRALEQYRDGGMATLTQEQRDALYMYVGGVDFKDIRSDQSMARVWPTAGQAWGNHFLEPFYSALGKPAPEAPAVDNRAEIDRTNPVHNIVNYFAHNAVEGGNPDEIGAVTRAVNAWNDGNAPTPEDRQVLRDYLVKHAEATDDAVLRQNMNEWVKYLDGGAAVPAIPAAPAAPQQPEDIKKAIADAVEARYAELRANPKDNAARRQAIAVQDAGDIMASNIQTALDYNDGHGNNDDTRDTYVRDAANQIDKIRADNPELAAQLDEHIKNLRDVFARQSAQRLIDRYLGEADKYHNADKPNNDQRDRMIKAAQDQIDKIRSDYPALADEMQAKLDGITAQYAVDDKERARAVPIGRTEAIVNFDAQIDTERKRLRDAGDPKAARDLVTKAEIIAEKLNDAEDAHKAGDQAGRDAALDEARNAIPDLEAINPDLAEEARKAVEGNAARYAREDSMPNIEGLGDTIEVGIGEAHTRIEIPETADETSVEAAARAFVGLTKQDISNMARGHTPAPAGYKVRHLGGGCVGDTQLITHIASKQRFIIKSDGISPLGLEAEEDMAILYRALGLPQPAVYRLRAENDGDDIIMMDFAGRDLGITDAEQYLEVGMNMPGLDELDLADEDDALRYVLSNVIGGQTDRHYGNVMFGHLPDGHGQPLFIDNGLAMFNGGWRPSDDTSGRKNHHSPWKYNPMEQLWGLGVAGNVNQNRHAAIQRARAIGYEATKETLSEWAQRMRDEALRRQLEFRNSNSGEFIARRAQWVLDNIDAVTQSFFDQRWHR